MNLSKLSWCDCLYSEYIKERHPSLDESIFFRSKTAEKRRMLEIKRQQIAERAQHKQIVEELLRGGGEAVAIPLPTTRAQRSGS